MTTFLMKRFKKEKTGITDIGIVTDSERNFISHISKTRNRELLVFIIRNFHGYVTKISNKTLMHT